MKTRKGGEEEEEKDANERKLDIKLKKKIKFNVLIQLANSLDARGECMQTLILHRLGLHVSIANYRLQARK